MDAMKHIGVIILFVCGSYFLIEALKLFPEKRELEHLAGQISSVGQCNNPIKGRFFQNITITGTDGRVVEFKRPCISSFERLVEHDMGKSADIYYEIDYVYFLYPEVEVFHLDVEEVTYTDYIDKKTNLIIRPFNLIVGFIFIFISIFMAIKIFNKRVNKDAR